MVPTTAAPQCRNLVSLNVPTWHILYLYVRMLPTSGVHYLTLFPVAPTNSQHSVSERNRNDAEVAFENDWDWQDDDVDFLEGWISKRNTSAIPTKYVSDYLIWLRAGVPPSTTKDVKPKLRELPMIHQHVVQTAKIKLQSRIWRMAPFEDQESLRTECRAMLLEVLVLWQVNVGLKTTHPKRPPRFILTRTSLIIIQGIEATCNMTTLVCLACVLMRIV